jgi:hypothetical protein
MIVNPVARPERHDDELLRIDRGRRAARSRTAS